MNVYQDYHELIIVGGGLAGCEAAWQAAIRGIKVNLYEMRPFTQTGAHTSPYLAELVCSNSLGSNLPDRAAGVLKEELRALGSLLIQCADESAVPAGGALAVDRELFAQKVTSKIENHPNITVFREEVKEIPKNPTIIASGPLTSPALTKAIQELTGFEQIFFYDAVAPIVFKDSINMDVSYQASRYGKNREQGGADYLNCPMNKEEYSQFVNELTQAERTTLLGFEDNIKAGVRAGAHNYFEGCLPVEVIAMRGERCPRLWSYAPGGLNQPSNRRAFIRSRPIAAGQPGEDALQPGGVSD